MPSKQVTDRSRSSGIVRTNAETFAAEVGAKTHAQLSPFLQAGEVMPDGALQMKLFARYLASKMSLLEQADSAHEAEISDDAPPRAERDEAEGELRETTVEFRNAIGAKYGDVGLKVMGLYEAPPRGAPELAKYGRSLHDALIDASRTLTGSARRGLHIDRAEMATELLATVERLEAALRTVTHEAAELHLTQTAKDRAMDNNDEAFAGVAKAVEGLLTLAGRKDLAERVRPSGRKPGVVEVDHPEPAAG